MRADTKKKSRSTNGRRRRERKFDGEGIERALLAALECTYQRAPHLTLPQFLVALEVAMAERDGEPHTLVSLVGKLDMPFSTASRVVWSLTEEGGEVGVVKYIQHPTDRRKKLLVVDSRAFGRAVPRAMQRAMLEYYGDSVNRLRRMRA
jgi:DNA-binding MarR family transcriptional regulator